MRPSGIQGSWVAVPTPMNSDHTIDYAVFEQIIDFHADNGTSALLIGGSAGEVAVLTQDERREIIRRTAPYGRGRIPLYYGTSSASVKDSVDMTKWAQDNGAYGALLTVPAYSLPPQRAILDYFVRVISSVDMPMGIYNNPTRVGATVTPQSVLALKEACPNFEVDKEAVPDPVHVIEVLELLGDSISVFCCDNPHYGHLPTVVSLGDGMANITGNLAPREMAAISTPIDQQADLNAWRKNYFELIPLMRACYSLTNPVIIKAGMELLGFQVGPVREPLQGLNIKKTDELKALIDKYNLVDHARKWAEG